MSPLCVSHAPVSPNTPRKSVQTKSSVPRCLYGMQELNRHHSCRGVTQRGQIASASGPSLSRMSSVDTEAGGEQEAAVRLLSLHRRLLTELEGVKSAQDQPRHHLKSTASCVIVLSTPWRGDFMGPDSFQPYVVGV